MWRYEAASCASHTSVFNLRDGLLVQIGLHSFNRTVLQLVGNNDFSHILKQQIQVRQTQTCQAKNVAHSIRNVSAYSCTLKCKHKIRAYRLTQRAAVRWTHVHITSLEHGTATEVNESSNVLRRSISPTSGWWLPLLPSDVGRQQTIVSSEVTYVWWAILSDTMLRLSYLFYQLLPFVNRDSASALRKSMLIFLKERKSLESK
jgi:hypothetical protein